MLAKKLLLRYPLSHPTTLLAGFDLPTIVVIQEAGNKTWGNIYADKALDAFRKFNTNLIRIGDGVQTIAYKKLADELERLKYMNGPIIVYVRAHGLMIKTPDISHLTYITDQNLSIRDLILLINQITHDKPIELFLDSCHSGAFAHKDSEVLSNGSIAYMTSSWDKGSNLIYSNKMFQTLGSLGSKYKNRFSAKLLTALHLNSINDKTVSPTIKLPGYISDPVELKTAHTLFNNFHNLISQCSDYIKREFSDFICKDDANCYQKISRLAASLSYGAEPNDVGEQDYGKALGIYMATIHCHLNGETLDKTDALDTL